MRLQMLGLPPSTNNLYAIVNKHQILSAEGRRFHEALAAVARLDLGETKPHDGPVALRIAYRLRHDRDVDGSHKTVLDALSGIFYGDDRQVVALEIDKRKALSTEPARLRVSGLALETAPAFVPLTQPADGLLFRTDLLPPSTNNTYAVVGRIRRLTREGRATKEAYAAALQEIGGQPYEGRLRVRVRYGYEADRRDVDGSHKLLLDAARGVLWHDDLQIDSISFSKGRVAPGERARIEMAVWEIGR